MIFRRIIWAVFLITLGVSSYLLQFKAFGSLPAFGVLFAPNNGILRNPPISRANTDEELKLGASSQPVKVHFDERAVPHISAQNDTDLYRAQGYIVARERLFEMDLSSRAPLGRLAELFGPSKVEADVHMRQLGLYQSARALEKTMMNDPDTAAMVTAYTEGVNAVISEIKNSPSTLPLEYWLIGAEPEAWSPLKTAAIVRIMGWRMSGSELENEIRRTTALTELGSELFSQVYSAPFKTPESYPGWTPSEVNPPAPTKEVAGPILARFKLGIGEIPSKLNGSNSWAISGTRTMSGNPILANDPHLGLHVPAIWYEQQLISPDQNTYGVAVPGVPAILIGFNRDIAWGITNSGIDALDIFKMEISSENQNDYYKQDGNWEPLERIEEVLRVRSSPEIQFPTYWSHQGPIIASQQILDTKQSQKAWLAIHWTGHFGSDEPGSLRKLNHMQNCDGIKDAFKSFVTPILNLTCIDRRGSIAMHVIGKVPLRSNDGRFVSDGTRKDTVWTSFLSQNQTPHIVNPESNFILSANQSPIFPTPGILNGNFATSERSGQIEHALKSRNLWTIENAKNLQSNSEGEAASKLLPLILKVLVQQQSKTDLDREVIEALAIWDNSYKKDFIAPTIFEALYLEIANQFWTTHLKTSEWKTRYPVPNRQITWNRILEIGNNLPDANDSKEMPAELRTLIETSYAKAKERLLADLGSDPKSWTWGRYRQTEIRHLTKIPILGLQRPISTDGSPDTINAIAADHGPSWRMVVEMTPDGPVAFGVYPGGQSGRPGAREFSQFVSTWESGDLYRLHFSSTNSKSGQVEKKNLVSKGG